jgi:FdhD protein
MGRLAARARITRITETGCRSGPDTVVVEEPLEIRINGAPLAVTMRIPGSDVELAKGFLFTEGIIGDRADIASVRYCNSVDADGRNTYNVLEVDLAPGVSLPDTGIERHFYTTSSCGVCGKASIAAIRQRSRYRPADDTLRVRTDAITRLPARLRAAQKVFDTTGGLHAAGLFTAEGQLLAVREDVGRHNAVDKLLGWAVEQDRIPLRATVLLVSGRHPGACRCLGSIITSHRLGQRQRPDADRLPSRYDNEYLHPLDANRARARRTALVVIPRRPGRTGTAEHGPLQGRVSKLTDNAPCRQGGGAGTTRASYSNCSSSLSRAIPVIGFVGLGKGARCCAGCRCGGYTDPFAAT